MQIINNPQEDTWEALAKRPMAESSHLFEQVKKIMDEVKQNGDRALYSLGERFDQVQLSTIKVSEEEIATAAKYVSNELKAAIAIAMKNISRFHTSQKEPIKKIETMPGVTCWRQSIPIEKVGFYIPGGTAPLFSTLLMLAVPAQIAGCREIIICTPPQKDGTIHPAILYTASECGINQIYKIGGAQAVAAMTYGTETVPKVYKIFGPGNQYVTAAKQLAQQEYVAIDMPAGPSEVLVLADETANPAFVAADLLAQAEHGKDSQAMLATTSLIFAENVLKELDYQLKKLPRRDLAKVAIENSKAIVFSSLNKAVQFSNQYAPEHLIVSCVNASELATTITTAGSVFIGHYSPESVGDYASGTNHTLPTNGYAAMYSGVSVDSFVKKITFQELTQQGLEAIGNTVMEMAAAEGLEAHKNAVAIRLKK